MGFFQAFDPTSKDAGRINKWCVNYHKNNTDLTVSERISIAWNNDLEYYAGLQATYHIIYGCHYFDLVVRNEPYSKGALDYLLFPLVARKIIRDAWDRDDHSWMSRVAYAVAILCIAVPIELARFGVALAMTLLLALVVAMVHLIRFVGATDPTLPESFEDDDSTALTAELK